MHIQNKILIPALLSLLSLLLLQACGGGGGGGAAFPIAPPSAADAPPAPPPATADSGSVSAPFEPRPGARHMLLGVSSQSFGTLTQSTQAASGAMTKLNDTTLTGATTTKEISGDANFALGRWVAGTVTRSSGAETLTGTDNRAYHYVAFNALPALPTTGSASCDAGVFSGCTYGTHGQGAIFRTHHGRKSRELRQVEGRWHVQGGSRHLGRCGGWRHRHFARSRCNSGVFGLGRGSDAPIDDRGLEEIPRYLRYTWQLSGQQVGRQRWRQRRLFQAGWRAS